MLHQVSRTHCIRALVHPGRADRLRSDPLDDDKARSRRRLILLVTPIVVLFTAATIASAFTPALASKHPLLLIILEARNRNLVLARRVDFVPFLLVATFRRMLTDPLFFLLGHYYGDNAVRWVEEKVPGWGPMVRVLERFFAKASYPVVFLFPGAVVCALAGATGMSFGVFMLLNLGGTLFAVLVLRGFGDILGGPVDALLDFFGRYTWQTTAVTFGLVALSFLLARLEGRTIPTVNEIEAELEGDSEGPERPRQSGKPEPDPQEPKPETDEVD